MSSHKVLSCWLGLNHNREEEREYVEGERMKENGVMENLIQNLLITKIQIGYILFNKLC